MTSAPKHQSFWTSPASALILLPIISLVLNWPYLFSGYALDDIIINNAVGTDPFPFSRWLGVWAGAMFHKGFTNIWWIDPDVQIHFWRPIPSLILEGFMRVFGRNALPLHLLSILLHGLVGTALYIFVRKLSLRHSFAFVAGLFYVVSEDHSGTVGWISTFTDIVCVLFILLSFISHIEWLKFRKARSLIWSIVALIIALGCKETASIAPVGTALLTLLMPNGSADENILWSGFWTRFRQTLRDYMSWMPSLIVLILYFIAYLTVGPGGMKNLLYIYPIFDPGLYFSHLLVHLPLMLLGTFTPVLLNNTMFDPSLLKPLILPGIVIFIAWIFALLPFRNRPLEIWSFVFYFLALLPQLCTDASSRGLYFPLIPASILIASVTMTTGPFVSRRTVPVERGTRWTRFMGWVALSVIFVPAVVISILSPFTIVSAFKQPEIEFKTALPYIEAANPEHVIFLNSSGMLLTLYSYDYVHYLTGKIYDVSLLSSVDAVVTLERTGERSFIIRTDRPGWLSSFTARVMRTKAKVEEGRSYDKDTFVATIVETTDDHLDALAVEFDFKMPLDDPELLFLRWNGETFEPMDLTALNIGETVELADTSKLW